MSEETKEQAETPAEVNAEAEAETPAETIDVIGAPATEAISAEADRLRRDGEDAAPIEVLPSGGGGVVIQSFFTMPAPSPYRYAAARTINFSREQTLIINSGVAYLQEIDPDRFPDPFTRVAEAITEICRLFSGIKFEEITAADTGRANVESVAPEGEKVAEE